MGSLFFYRHFSLPMRHGRRLFFSTRPISSGIYRNIEANHSLRSTESTGLYGFDILSSPQGFRKFAQDAIQRSEELITHIKMLPPSEEVIRAVDDIFNTVDTVVSSAELCVSTHPDREYVEEAERAHVKMSEHFFYLCSNRELYTAVSESNNKTKLKTDEAQRAARALQIDFEKFGTHLCQDKQALVNQLNIEIQDLSNQFVSNILNYPGEFDVFPASQIPKWLHSQFQKIESMNGTSLSKSKPVATTSGLRIVTRPEVLNEILNWTEDEQTLGYPSYSDFVLAPTMASSTDVVMSFLKEMSNLIKNKADKWLMISNKGVLPANLYQGSLLKYLHPIYGHAVPVISFLGLNIIVKSMTKAKKLFDATDLQRQVVYSMIDQSFFGKQPLSSVDTISMVENLTEKYTSWRNVQGTHWYTRFHHLLGYGAGYYSYLYARCFASSIWKKVCSQDPLSLEAGSIIRNELLKHGGSKDPTMLIRKIIGETALKECHVSGVKPNIDDLFEELEM